MAALDFIFMYGEFLNQRILFHRMCINKVYVFLEAQHVTDVSDFNII